MSITIFTLIMNKIFKFGFQTQKANGYEHNMDGVIILNQLHVSYPMRSGQKEKSMHLRVKFPCRLFIHQILIIERPNIHDPPYKWSLTKDIIHNSNRIHQLLTSLIYSHLHINTHQMTAEHLSQRTSTSTPSIVKHITTYKVVGLLILIRCE